MLYAHCVSRPGLSRADACLYHGTCPAYPVHAPYIRRCYAAYPSTTHTVPTPTYTPGHGGCWHLARGVAATFLVVTVCDSGRTRCSDTFPAAIPPAVPARQTCAARTYCLRPLLPYRYLLPLRAAAYAVCIGALALTSAVPRLLVPILIFSAAVERHLAGTIAALPTLPRSLRTVDRLPFARTLPGSARSRMCLLAVRHGCRTRDRARKALALPPRAVHHRCSFARSASP